MSETKRGETTELTEGSIGKQLLKFFLPIMFGTFFQQLYNTIDAIVVGRFVGSNALAAVGGSAGMIVNLIVEFFVGLTAGATVIVSQYFGSGDKDKMNKGMHTIYAFSIAGSVGISIIGYVLAPTLKKQIYIGFPGGVQTSMYALSNVFIYRDIFLCTS